MLFFQLGEVVSLFVFVLFRVLHVLIYGATHLVEFLFPDIAKEPTLVDMRVTIHQRRRQPVLLNNHSGFWYRFSIIKCLVSSSWRAHWEFSEDFGGLQGSLLLSFLPDFVSKFLGRAELLVGLLPI